MTKPDTARDKNPKINMDYRAEEKTLGQYKKKGYVQLICWKGIKNLT